MNTNRDGAIPAKVSIRRVRAEMFCWRMTISATRLNSADAMDRARRQRTDRRPEIRLLQYRVLIRILLRTDPVAKDVPVAGIAVVAIGTVHADRNDCSYCRRTAAATEAIPVKSATAMEAATSATASIGSIGDQACAEQNDYRKSSENIAKHDSKLPSNSPLVGNCGARFAGC